MQPQSILLRSSAALLLASFVACGGGTNSTTTTAAPAGTTFGVPTAPAISAFAPAGATPFVVLPGLGNDFLFAPGAAYVESPDGTAFVAGVLESRSQPERRVEARVTFANRVVANTMDPAAAKLPRLDLDAAAYVDEGGPVDPALFAFHDVTAGALFGLDALRGFRAELGAADATGLQSGVGANNRDVAVGGSVRLALVVTTQASGAGAPTAADGEFELAFARASGARVASVDSPGDDALDLPERAALFLPGLGGEFELVGGGDLSEDDAGRARFEGVFTSVNDPTRRFSLELQAHSRVDALAATTLPTGSPNLALPLAAYRASAGPVDPTAWRFYADVEGTLRGLGALDGARVRVSQGSFPLQVGLGANGADCTLGASTSLALELVRQPNTGDLLDVGQPDGSLNLALRQAYIACADESYVDPVYGISGDNAFWIPELATDFVIVAGGEFRENADGTAELRAEIQSPTNPNQHWYAVVAFTGRVDSGDANYPPDGSPKKLLAPAAYLENGGPIDAATWHYYTSSDGFLHGLGGLHGAVIGLQRFGPAFQVGIGANGINLHYGGSGWLSVQLLTQPNVGPELPTVYSVGDVNIDVERGCKRCPVAAPKDPLVYGGNGGHAFWLPGIGTDFVFEPGAVFVERGDGTAQLRGTLRRKASATKRFETVVDFDGRVDPGQPAYPPAGSPKKELLASAYVENGGPIDTATWHYYTSTDGVLVGLDDYVGARIEFTRMGPSFQVGLGASGKNLDFGAAGWLNATIVAQPTNGPSFALTNHPDININVFDECP